MSQNSALGLAGSLEKADPNPNCKGFRAHGQGPSRLLTWGELREEGGWGSLQLLRTGKCLNLFYAPCGAQHSDRPGEVKTYNKGTPPSSSI